MLSKQERNLGLRWLSSEVELMMRALVPIGHAINLGAGLFPEEAGFVPGRLMFSLHLLVN